MGNSVRRLIGGVFVETIMSVAGASATPDVASDFHTALEESVSSSLDSKVALGDHGGAGSSTEPNSEYFSARAEEMMRSRSQFSSAVEHEIEHSKVHWSELSSPSEITEESSLSNSSEDSKHYEEVFRENVEVFAELMNDPRWRHHKFGAFFQFSRAGKLGRKIAEGGQAEIFELLRIDGTVNHDTVLKVFKRGSRLSDLRRQWPCGTWNILQHAAPGIIVDGLMLEDGRFAFELLRCWGDLRKLIDKATHEKNNQSPPFPCKWNGGSVLDAKFIVYRIAHRIAHHMNDLHKKGILHRGLKSSNVLIYAKDGFTGIFVADYECSIGVVGTGSWRAPEVLVALKNYQSNIEFSKKVNVYGYAMTCFEIVTRRLPFEGELESCRTSNDLIIGGQRPKLPSDLDGTLKDLIERCWHGDPNERPSFSKIIEVLHSF